MSLISAQVSTPAVRPFAVRLIGETPRLTVAVSGEVDTLTAPELRTVLEDVARPGLDHLLVDLSEVSFLDSAGLCALAAGHQAAAAAGATTAVRCRASGVAGVLRLTGLWDLLGAEIAED